MLRAARLRVVLRISSHFDLEPVAGEAADVGHELGGEAQLARRGEMDSTKLRCNAVLYVSPQARTFGMSTTVACEMRSLGTVLCDTLAHPTASMNGARKMRHGHSANGYTRAALHRRVWLDRVETHSS